MCARSPESQPCPGLHQKKHGQQVEGGDSVLLLHSAETPPAVLRPALGSPAQERHGAVGARPEKGHKDGQRAATALLCRKAERDGVVEPGEEEAPGRPHCSLSMYKEGTSTLFGLLAGLSRQSRQPQGPGGTPTTLSHGELLSRSLLR